MQQRCAPSWRPSADIRRRARSPGLLRCQPLPRGEPGPQSVSGPLDEEKRAAKRGPKRSLQAARVTDYQPPDWSRAQRSPVAPSVMRPPTTASYPGRALWNSWRRFLPLTLAVFVCMGHAQRDLVGRYEQTGRGESRLWRPGGSHPAAAAAKVYSLFLEQDAPVPGSPPAERAQLGLGSPRRPAETEARRLSRAQQPRRVRPPAQTWRSSPWGQQQPAPRARAAPALPRFGTLQRPRTAPPTLPRGRLTG